ncbi:hypothetical protein U0070_008532 [Myodes glareolus]|uniref:Solute carrier family 39 member 2 n=1 Tax=Myodes glareolus TaxID=447135 RepID=A0AAW0HN44_MYOGA
MFTSVSGVPWSHGYRQGGDASVDMLQILPEPSRTPIPSKCILPLLASLGGGRPRRSSRSKHLRPFCFSRGLQAFAALVPGVSQVDNNSDFLGKKPHRKHPGILRLPHVRLPQALSNAAQLLLLGEKLRGGETKETKRGQHAVMRLYVCDHRETRPHYREADSAQTEEKLREAVLHALRRTTYHWQKLRAAHSTWGHSLREYVCVDTSAAMLGLAEKLLTGGSESGKPCIPGVFFRQFLPVSPKASRLFSDSCGFSLGIVVQFDVVVSAFALSELPSKADRTEVVQNLWRKTSRFLVLVENGTKAGHRLLMEARSLVLQEKEKSPLDLQPGFVFAPPLFLCPFFLAFPVCVLWCTCACYNALVECPHELPCPQLTASKPLACSFSQAYHPIPFSWNKKPKEETFSMVILARGSPKEAPRWPRITQPVLKRPRHVHCHLCCPDGHTQHAVVTARRHGRYWRWICIAVPVSAPGETFCLWSLCPLLKSPQRVDEDADVTSVFFHHTCQGRGYLVSRKTVLMEVLLGVKIGCLLALLVLTLGCGLAPIYFRWFQMDAATGRHYRVLSLLGCISAGVFLGAGLMHMTAEALEGIESEIQKLVVQVEYPYGELVISLGFFFVFLLESLALQYCQGDAGGSTVREEEWGGTHAFGFHKHPPVPSPSQGPLRALVLLISLSFHSVFEGLAVGLQTTVAATVQLCVAVLAHKGLVVFSVGLRLLKVGAGSWWATFCILSLALMSPVGLALGLTVAGAASGPGQGLAQAVLEGVAAGTFLYVTFLEILPRELACPEGPLVKCGCVAAGFAFMALIALWA